MSIIMERSGIETPTLSRSDYQNVIETAIADAELPSPEADWLRKHAEETEEVAYGGFEISGIGCAMKQAGVYEPVEGRAIPTLFSRFAFAFDERMRELIQKQGYVLPFWRVVIED